MVVIMKKQKKVEKKYFYGTVTRCSEDEQNERGVGGGDGDAEG